MHVINLEGKEFPIKSTSKQEYELNGNQKLETLIESNKVNDLFIKDISQMWSIVDFDDVEHKIIYLKRTGKGSKMTVDIKSIPLFFHAFDKDRIYKEYNEHMTAQVAFRRIFEGTGYTFVIHGSFKAVQWEGFGAGEARLETFKRALERYKAEFEIKGNTIHLKNLIGRDTQFQYRYRLNASDIVQEVDANDMWTYAKGYGDYGDGDGGEDWKDANLEREYTSPLAKIEQIGKLHAPPIKNGNITDVKTMDKDLKTLVDESLQISVSATLHDLRKQGYELAQPEKGDRVFLIDERIGFDQDIRVVFLSTVKDWKGNIIDLDVDFGNVGLTKRHQANIDTAIKNIQDVISGNKELPYNVLDEAVRRATESLKSAQTELIFDNGIIAQEKKDPNRFVLLNSKGIGITDDGGGTFREAITADGFVLSAGAIGRLSANNIQIGAETDYESDYDPSKKETPEEAERKIKEMKDNVDKEIGEVITDLDEFNNYIEHAFKDGIIEESEAIAIEKYINSLETEKNDVNAQYTEIYMNEFLTGTAKSNLLNSKVNYNGAHDELIRSVNDAIANGKTTVAEKADVDAKFLAYRKTLTILAKRFEQSIDVIAQNKANKAEDNAKYYADEMKKDIDKEVSEVGESLEDLDQYIEHSFKDGIIEEAEAKAIEKYINSLNSEKSDVDSKYTEIYKNVHLDGAVKTNLLNSKTNYNGAHNNLIKAINDAIANGKTTVAEKNNVDSKFTAYRSMLSTLAQRFEQAIDKIAQSKADVAEDNAKEHADGNDVIMRENLRITSALPTSLTLNHDGITAYTVKADGYARLDHRGLYIKGGAIQIDGGLSDNQIGSSEDWNGTKSEVDANKGTWNKASILNADGTLNSSKLKGKLSDTQLASAKKWNGQGTHIGSNGVYTGAVVASQVVSGTLDAGRVKVLGGGATDYTLIDGSFFESRGKHTRSWMGKTTTHDIRLRAENGYFRARNNNKEWSLYFSDWGISTYADGTGDDDASGYIEFHSPQYSPTNSNTGITIGSLNGRLGLETDGNRIYLNPGGADVFVANKNERFYNLRASIIYSNGIRQHPDGAEGKHLYLGASQAMDAEVRVTNLDLGSGSPIGYRPLRAGGLFSNTLTTTTESLWLGSNSAVHIVNKGHTDDFDEEPIYRDLYAGDFVGRKIRTSTTNFSIGVDNMLLVVNKGFSDIFRDVKAKTYWGDAFATTSRNLYLGSDGETRSVNKGKSGIYRPVRASDFIRNSTRDAKTNIVDMKESSLDIINDLKGVEYDLKDDLKEGVTDNRQVGFISEDSPRIASKDGKGISEYKHTTHLTRAVQELSIKLDKANKEIEKLKGAI